MRGGGDIAPEVLDMSEFSMFSKLLHYISL
jgi:hypothetical protein